MFGTGILRNGRRTGLMDYATRIRQWLQPEPEEITVFHITHQKAGSQWINRILHALCYDRLILPEVESRATHERPVEGVQILDRPVQPGKIYPTLYLTQEQFATVPLPRHHRSFIIIRDPRDTMVSAYFSYKLSHTLNSDWMHDCRLHLNRVSTEEGLLFILDNWLPSIATFQWSWVASGQTLIKYEHLLKNDEAILEHIFLRQCRLPIERKHFLEVVRANRFEAWTGGRRRGQEDVASHERKGIAGDWRNYFTPRVAAAFRSRYASLLVATGYEQDERW
jgi:lipopolysaccharide transport system ATP-binding protein